MSKLVPYYDLFIYHDKCMDGLVSVAVATQMGAGRISPVFDILAADYSKEIDIEMVRDKRVCFLDFSCKKERMLELLEVATYITVIDHHVGVYEELSSIVDERFKYVYNVNLSGAQLTWQYFIRRHEPVFISMIGDRDLWTKKFTHSDQLNLALRTLDVGYHEMYEHVNKLIQELPKPTDNIYEYAVLPGLDEKTLDWVMKGLDFQKYHDKMVKEVASHAWDERLDDDSDTEVLKVNCPLGLMSDVGALLAPDSPSGVVWLYYELGDNTKHSLRVSADSEYDASAFAKSLGGGGHKKAAGWTTDRWRAVPMPDFILEHQEKLVAAKKAAPKNPLV